MEDRLLLEEVYGELRKIAAIHLSRGLKRPSIEPTQLVHEAWIRLADRGWRSKTHFLALASRTMRMLLVDNLRARMAQKRDAGERVDSEPEIEFSSAGTVMPLDRILDVDKALDELALKDPRRAQVVEMRFFGGLEFQEVAEALEISLATAKRDWEFARSWLFARLSSASDAP